jgi:hypothetical protein
MDEKKVKKREGLNEGAHGSKTMTITANQTEEKKQDKVTITVKDKEDERPRRSVQWSQETVDNENMGKKSSKGVNKFDYKYIFIGSMFSVRFKIMAIFFTGYQKFFAEKFYVFLKNFCKFIKFKHFIKIFIFFNHFLKKFNIFV